MSDGTMRTLEELSDRLRAFRDDRDWATFHSPRNLLMALVGEVGELAAELQWVLDSEVQARLQESDFRSRVENEIADVLIYLTYLADACQVDLLEVASRKVSVNESRFPPAASR